VRIIISRAALHKNTGRADYALVHNRAVATRNPLDNRALTRLSDLSGRPVSWMLTLGKPNRPICAAVIAARKTAPMPRRHLSHPRPTQA
jgi:hypothetical protein